MASCSSCTATSACSRWAPAPGYAAAVLSRLCAAGGDRSSATRASPTRRPRRSRELGYDNVEVRVGDGARGRARPGAVRRHLGDRHRRGTSRRRRCSSSWRRARALVCPVARGRREHLMRFRDGERGGRRGRALRAARERRRMIREFSAGGVVVRAHPRAGRSWRSCASASEILALPKGHPDGDETPAEAAQREVREETGLEAELVEKLGDVRYWYVRDGERVIEDGRVLPVPLPLGQRRGPRPRGRGGALDPARRGAGAARLQGRARDGRCGALTGAAKAARLPRSCSSSTSTRRSSSTSSSAAARRPRSGSATRARSTARARSC